MTNGARLPRAIFSVFLFLSVSVRVTPADAESGDYSDHDDLDEVVLSCEEAAAALAACCPGFDPRTVRCIDHRYRTTSYCTGNVSEGHERPELALDESTCIRRSSCSDLVASTCARAQVILTQGLRADAGVAAPGACL